MVQEETKRLKGKKRDVDMFQTLKLLQDHLGDLQNRFSALPIITGFPVIVKVEDMSLCMNYDLLKKFEQSFYKSNFWGHSVKIKGKSLIMKYKSQTVEGVLELFELPAHQTELLTGLPTIDLKE